jgi:DNA-directed RNA polymerase subunit M/transcription elongation factor TFIIS
MNPDDLTIWAMAYPESALANIMQREKIARNLVSDINSGIICKKCKTQNPLIWQRQTRSADEAMTVFFLCRNPVCGKRWRE